MRKILLTILMILLYNYLLAGFNFVEISTKYFTEKRFPFYLDGISIEQLLLKNKISDEEFRDFQSVYFTIIAKDIHKFNCEVDSLDNKVTPLFWCNIQEQNLKVLCTLHELKSDPSYLKCFLQVFNSNCDTIYNNTICYSKDNNLLLTTEFISFEEIYELRYNIDSNCKKHISDIIKMKFSKRGLSYIDMSQDQNFNLLSTYNQNYNNNFSLFINQIYRVNTPFLIDKTFFAQIINSNNKFDIFPHLPESYQVIYGNAQCRFTNQKLYPLGKILLNDSSDFCLILIESDCNGELHWNLNCIIYKDGLLLKISNIYFNYRRNIESIMVDIINQSKIQCTINNSIKKYVKIIKYI
jgi:hypothetical protein